MQLLLIYFPAAVCVGHHVPHGRTGIIVQSPYKTCDRRKEDKLGWDWCFLGTVVVEGTRLKNDVVALTCQTQTSTYVVITCA